MITRTRLQVQQYRLIDLLTFNHLATVYSLTLQPPRLRTADPLPGSSVLVRGADFGKPRPHPLTVLLYDIPVLYTAVQVLHLVFLRRVF